MTRAALLSDLDAIESFTSRVRHNPSEFNVPASAVTALFRAIGATARIRQALEDAEVTDIEVAGGWPDVVAVEWRAS